jgi:hypothetical protein
MNNPEKKYRCLGGWVVSKSDSDRHYISAYRVAELYGVNPAECLFVEAESGPNYGYRKEYIVIDMWPRDDGKYELPLQRKSMSSNEYNS